MHQLVFKIFLYQFYFSPPEFCCRIHFLYMCLKIFWVWGVGFTPRLVAILVAPFSGFLVISYSVTWTGCIFRVCPKLFAEQSGFCV